MPSTFPNYSYDIFISYRQKDNRSDQWVTQFVQALKEELDATFKEDISVYFDENPHDGLHDTHDVDDSLKEKVKCLIFIPIVSRTYCDPKSFAWQKEFLPFLDFAKNDEHGLKVKLANGNVTNRVLPIRIHDLDTEDVKLFEKETGSVIRSIDFVYKEAGVNRPLRPKVDDPLKNQNHTVYRDQINKVANAIREIVVGMKQDQSGDKVETPRKGASFSSVDKKGKINRSYLTYGATVVIVLLLFTLYYWFFMKGNVSKDQTVVENEFIDKSIAVLPLHNLANDPNQEYFINGLSDIIQSRLSKLSDLDVTSMRSVWQYQGTDKLVPQIGKELNIGHVLDGSLLRIGDSIRAKVQLVSVATGKILWSEDYKRHEKNLFQIDSDIARQVARILKLKLNDREAKAINYVQEIDVKVYEHVFSGNQRLQQLALNSDSRYIVLAEQQFDKALKIAHNNVDALIGKGKVYRLKGYYGKGNHWLDSVIVVADKILSKNKDNGSAYLLKAQAHMALNNRDTAKNNFRKTILVDPNNSIALMTLSRLIEPISIKESVRYIIKSLRIDQGNESVGRFQNNDIGVVYLKAELFDFAEEYFLKQVSLYPDLSYSYYALIYLYIRQGRIGEAKKFIKMREEKALDNKDNFNVIDIHAWQNYLVGNYDEADSIYSIQLNKISSGFEENSMHDIFRHRYAHIRLIKGDTEEGMTMLEYHIEFLNRTSLSYYDLAGAYALMGNKEEAYRTLESMPTSVWLNLFAKFDPMFDSLRDETRFKNIMKKHNTEIKEYRDELLRLENNNQMHWLRNR